MRRGGRLWRLNSSVSFQTYETDERDIMLINFSRYYLPAFVAFAVVYFQTFAWIFQSWSTYNGSHGPIILAISFYILWTKRDVLKGLVAEPNLPLGLLLTVSGCLMLISGRFSSLLLLQYLSIIISLWGLVLLLGGMRWMREIWYSIGYLLFMFPIFSELLSGFSLSLQNAAAWIAFNIIAFAGTPVARSGVFLELPNITLEVARECNGINHIVALVSLAVPLAYWTLHTTGRRLILIASAFFIGVLANGLRVAIIGFLAVYKEGSDLHGPYDIFYVSFIFFFGMAFLLAISTLLKGRETNVKPQQVADSMEQNRHGRSNRLSPIIAATVIFAATAGYLILWKPAPIYLGQPLRNFPLSIGDWNGSDTYYSKPPFKYFRADEELKRVYRDGDGREIRLYIGYFRSQEQDREVVHYRFDPLQMNSETMRVPLGSSSIEINMKNGEPQESIDRIFFWYDINGRVISGRYSAKFATIMDAFLRRRTSAAIVVIDTKKRPGENDAANSYELDFIQKVFPLIQSFLWNRTT